MAALRASWSLSLRVLDNYLAISRCIGKTALLAMSKSKSIGNKQYLKYLRDQIDFISLIVVYVKIG